MKLSNIFVCFAMTSVDAKLGGLFRGKGTGSEAIGNGNGNPGQDQSQQPGISDCSGSCTTEAFDTDPTTWTEDEKALVVSMWAEEKMARDVYLDMYDLHGQRIFSNIANSEQNHMSTMKKIMDLAEISLPVDENGATVSEDNIGQMAASMQGLYDNFINQGTTQPYLMGKTLEEVDIADLEAAIEWVNDDLASVLENLLSGSHNHLRAFTQQLN